MWFLIFALAYLGLSSGLRRLPDPDAIYFPELSPETSERMFSNTSSKLADSIEFAKELSSMDSVDAMLERIQGSKMVHVSIAPRMAVIKRPIVQKAELANCIPEVQTVNIIENPDPSISYIPEYVRIKRCGGCCMHKLISCQPTATEVVNFEINTISLGGDRKKEVFRVEVHKACKCLCTIQEEHCNKKQVYLSRECRCKCENIDEEEKCNTSGGVKAWNPELCECHCRDRECPSRFYPDPNTCSCS